ncbi:MAG: anthranilate synthase component I family protein, partial [Nitrospirae bacterium]
FPDAAPLPLPASNMSREAFCTAVERIKRYIRAGDIFQAVFSQRFTVEVGELDPVLLYRVLRAINPSPYLFCLELEDQALVGSSPEVLVRVTGREVIVRPIAGTRPRGRDREEDERLERELLADPKERAEHLMLVDLGRNDVGRIARPGSVRVDELMVIERYSHVMHIVSNVVGELAEGVDPTEALPACFPAGTVSGAPKIRAMEIIEELEPDRRGSYAGAVGYLTLEGDLDTCIALRTVRLAGGTAEVQAGAGIVADSVPEREYEETENKARGMVQAIARALAIARS